MREHALRYLAAGLTVIPVINKRALFDWEQYQEQPPDAAQVAAWWDAWPSADIAVLLGRRSGVVRIDVDGATEALAAMGELPETAEFTTPSGGRGYLLQWEEWVTTTQLWRGSGEHQELRVQSDGAYTVVPPSPGYAWVRETPVARCPRWMLDIYTERAMRAAPSSALRCDIDDCQLREALAHVPADDYDTWTRVGMALRNRGDECLALWDEWSRTSRKYRPGECERKWATFRPDGGLTVATVLHFARGTGWRPAWSPYEPLTEGGNANVLARSAAGRAHWSSKLGWLAWDGRRWASGEAAECIVQELQKCAMAQRRAGVTASMARVTGDEVEALARRRQKLKTLGRIDTLDRAMCYRGSRDLARSAMTVDHETFNRRPTLLNFTNGTLDLETGALRPHDPRDRLTQLVPRDYDPGAACPTFHRFLEASVPDPATRAYLRLKLGSCLLGETRKELTILWGPEGDNGKTVLVELVLYCLGDDYAVKCPSDLLLHRSLGGDNDRNTVMLYGRRFAAASETNEGARLNEALLKELTGGDRVTSRYLFHEKFTFDPTHDVVYVTNHRPVVRGTDAALWNRIRLVEFPNSFPVGHAGRIEGLRGLLYGEAQGVTAWLAAACRDYVAAGRTVADPDAVRAVTAEYRAEHNPVAKFLAARGYERTDGTRHRLAKGRVAEAYRAWAATNHPQHQWNATWFGRQLTTLGVGSDKNYYFLQEGEGPLRHGLTEPTEGT